MNHESNAPNTWHYGLVAEWWAEFNVPNPVELAFYQSIIEGNGQPALDVACGTGRLLLPYLRAGLDVDGCDISPDMLALCRLRAEREGLSLRLYQQAMHGLDLPRVYRTIYICDSFGIGGSRIHDVEALERIYSLLAPGGTLVFSNDAPYAHVRPWEYWLPDKRRELPEDWPPWSPRRQASNGDQYALKSRIFGLNPLEQRLTLQIRAAKWREDRTIAEEEYSLETSIYFRNELVAMLEQVGFKETRVLDGYSAMPASPESNLLVFVSRK